MDQSKQTIWIDLDNSPHVPLFAPIINYYRKNGIEVIVTARDHAQTLELLDLHGFGGTYSVVGRHYGKGLVNKVVGTLWRAKQLISNLRSQISDTSKISVAVSHGSRSMVFAARWLGIPIITMYDYEHTETTIFNRFSDRVMVPERIPDTALDAIGLSLAKRVKYPGIKEELYIRAFEPSVKFLETVLNAHKLAEIEGKILAILRPPATTANYHSEKSEELFAEILRYLLNSESTFTIVVPRTRDQAGDIESLLKRFDVKGDNCLVLDKAVDGLNLAYAADLLISGGGTMNREAVLLGVPVYSIFAGKLGSLDAEMEKEGLITFIRNADDLLKIRLEPRKRTPHNALTDRVEAFVIDTINSYLE